MGNRIAKNRTVRKERKKSEKIKDETSDAEKKEDKFNGLNTAKVQNSIESKNGKEIVVCSALSDISAVEIGKQNENVDLVLMMISEKIINDAYEHVRKLLEKQQQKKQLVAKKVSFNPQTLQCTGNDEFDLDDDCHEKENAYNYDS